MNWSGDSRRILLVGLVLAMTALPLAACAAPERTIDFRTSSVPSSTPSPEPSRPAQTSAVSPGPTVAAPMITGPGEKATWQPVTRDRWTVRRCEAGPADLGSTNLRARTITSTTTIYDVPVQPGTLRLVSGPRLTLPDGQLRGDSPPGLLWPGEGDGPAFRVAPGRVTLPTTLAILHSEGQGDEVAYAEVQVRPTRPVRWAQERRLMIGTDGGDAGFGADGVMVGASELTMEYLMSDNVKAIFEEADRVAPVKPCTWLDRRGTGAVAMFWSTGGDGAWPVLVGRDADGRVASVVYDGLVVPWAMSGLPGAAPKDVVDAIASTRATARPDR